MTDQIKNEVRKQFLSMIGDGDRWIDIIEMVTEKLDLECEDEESIQEAIEIVYAEVANFLSRNTQECLPDTPTGTDEAGEASSELQPQEG